MNRPNHQPRDYKSRSDMGNGHVSTIESLSAGESVPAPDHSLQNDVSALMPVPTAHTRECLNTLMHNAITNVTHSQPRIKTEGAGLPTISGLILTSGQEQRVGLVKPTQIHSAREFKAISKPFGGLIGVNSDWNNSHQEDNLEHPHLVADKSSVSQEGLGLPKSAPELKVDTTSTVPSDSFARSAQGSPSLSSSRYFHSLGSVAERGGTETVAKRDSTTSSVSFRIPFAPLTSSSEIPGGSHKSSPVQSESPRTDSVLSSNHVVGDPSSMDRGPASGAKSSPITPFVALSRLQTPSIPFSSFLGSPRGVVNGQHDASPAGIAGTEGSDLTANDSGISSPSSSLFSTNAPSSGQGIDLSPTNELLQQLLEEYRKNQQSYLPLNERNSSMT